MEQSRSSCEALARLAEDADGRGCSALADSIRGMDRLMAVGDPVQVAIAADLWSGAQGADVALTRLLGPSEPYYADCAFVAGVRARLLSEVEAWFACLNASAAVADDIGSDDGPVTHGTEHGDAAGHV